MLPFVCSPSGEWALFHFRVVRMRAWYEEGQEPLLFVVMPMSNDTTLDKGWCMVLRMTTAAASVDSHENDQEAMVLSNTAMTLLLR